MKSFAILFFLCTSFSAFAQKEEPHEGPHHEHHRFEIGMANAPVYFLKEKEVTYGLHLHLVYQFENSKWGIGLGYEQIFDEHKHKTIGAVVGYRPISPVSLILSPGITFEGEDTQTARFASHFEVSYEFEIGNIHIGPVSEIAYDPEDIHLSLGLHIGIGF